MLTDAEIESLARGILADIVKRLEEIPDTKIFGDIHRTDDGEVIPVYEGTSQEGFGSFIFTYMPLAAVKRIVVECERLRDEFTVEITDSNTGEIVTVKPQQTAKSRDMSIRTMAENATFNLVGSFGFRMWEALEEGFNDALIMAKSTLSAVVAMYLEQKGISDKPADVRSYIEEAAKRVADKKRADLRSHIEGLPNLLAKRGQGAPRKPQAQKIREREAYLGRVKDAYRIVRRRESKKPAKIKVARELGEGGLSPKTGNDTSLQAFNRKLERHALNYDLIVETIESELNNNS